jgi:hypothetical protein
MGGTLFAGMTCSALTAGVMALGLAVGEIENSHTRVARMIATMAVRGAALLALADDGGGGGIDEQFDSLVAAWRNDRLCPLQLHPLDTRTSEVEPLM